MLLRFRVLAFCWILRIKCFSIFMFWVLLLKLDSSLLMFILLCICNTVFSFLTLFTRFKINHKSFIIFNNYRIILTVFLKEHLIQILLNFFFWNNNNFISRNCFRRLFLSFIWFCDWSWFFKLFQNFRFVLQLFNRESHFFILLILSNHVLKAWILNIRFIVNFTFEVSNLADWHLSNMINDIFKLLSNTTFLSLSFSFFKSRALIQIIIFQINKSLHPRRVLAVLLNILDHLYKLRTEHSIINWLIKEAAGGVMNSTEVFNLCFLFVLFFFLGHDELLFGVPLQLLSFDVFEHEFAFG